MRSSRSYGEELKQRYLTELPRPRAGHWEPPVVDPDWVWERRRVLNLVGRRRHGMGRVRHQ